MVLVEWDCLKPLYNMKIHTFENSRQIQLFSFFWVKNPFRVGL